MVISNSNSGGGGAASPSPTRPHSLFFRALTFSIFFSLLFVFSFYFNKTFCFLLKQRYSPHCYHFISKKKRLYWAFSQDCMKIVLPYLFSYCNNYIVFFSCGKLLLCRQFENNLYLLFWVKKQKTICSNEDIVYLLNFRTKHCIVPSSLCPCLGKELWL